MRFVLLTSKPDSPYADTPTKYEYPARYRRFFSPLEGGEPMIAIIYEPRSGGRGRMSYVGWAALRGVPVRSPRLTERGSHFGKCTTSIACRNSRTRFSVTIWVNLLNAGCGTCHQRNCNVVSSGASVRWLEEDEGRLILELGHAGQLGIASEYQIDNRRLRRGPGRGADAARRRSSRARRTVPSTGHVRIWI